MGLQAQCGQSEEGDKTRKILQGWWQQMANMLMILKFLSLENQMLEFWTL